MISTHDASDVLPVQRLFDLLPHSTSRHPPTLAGPSGRSNPVSVCMLALLAAAGCSTSDTLARLTPYRIEIVQGNVVTREQMARLSPGMTRDQVRDQLGAPLLTDVFHADRWDYVFTFRRTGVSEQRRSVVIWFEGERIKRIEAPELPSEDEFVAAISPARKGIEVPKLELSEAERRALPVAPRPAPATAGAQTAPTRQYPPLEPAR
jgi:outer membrane protein assembly factor BamE